MDKDLIIQLLHEQLRQQARLITMLKTTNAEKDKMIALREALIEQLKNNQKKDSSNSSKPPSSALVKHNGQKVYALKVAKKPEVPTWS